MTLPSSVDLAVEAVRSGGLVVIPTDTVYGLACTPHREEAVRRLSALKGRAPDQPVALLGATVDVVVECVPELRGRPESVARALLPGPLTLVLPNPARRMPWLAGRRPDTIGVRVPDLTGVAREFLDRSEAVAATSANLHGAADAQRLEEVAPEILAAVAAVVDGGEVPGLPSTVVDLTTAEPTILREGALPAGDVLARTAAALAE